MRIGLPTTGELIGANGEIIQITQDTEHVVVRILSTEGTYIEAMVGLADLRDLLSRGAPELGKAVSDQEKSNIVFLRQRTPNV